MSSDARLVRAVDEGWLLHARVCAVGHCTVAVPRRPRGPQDRRIVAFLDGKPVMKRDHDSTLLFDPNPLHADVTHPFVNVIAGTNGPDGRDVDRLWYQTTEGKDGSRTLTYDLNFDGQPDERIVSKGLDIVAGYVWYKNGWRRGRKQDNCVVYKHTCLDLKFSDGAFHRVDEGGNHKHLNRHGGT